MPDAKTILLSRERLTQAGAIERLFNRFDATLRNAGYLPMSGQILDATLVEAPKQRNTNAEKADLRVGRISEDWQYKPAKLSLKIVVRDGLLRSRKQSSRMMEPCRQAISPSRSLTRVCRQLIPMMAETNCTAARKVDFSLSYRVAIPLNCLSLAKKRSMMFRFL